MWGPAEAVRSDIHLFGTQRQVLPPAIHPKGVVGAQNGGIHLQQLCDDPVRLFGQSGRSARHVVVASLGLQESDEIVKLLRRQYCTKGRHLR